MKNATFSLLPRLAHLPLLCALVAGLAWSLPGAAQDKAADPGKHKHAAKPADADKDLPTQLRDLKAKVATLEAALEKHYPDVTGDKKMDMDKMKDGMGGMDMMEDDMDMMSMMGKGSMSGMGAKGMKMKMASALPGFPGASHIYHIGATAFFLDHPEHITLTTEQQTKLNKAKQKALLDKSKTQRQIDEAEQALWELTGADAPDVEQIEAKVQEIEKLRGEQRLAFIRSVGEAAKVLTDEQRKLLLGQTESDAHEAHLPATK